MISLCFRVLFSEINIDSEHIESLFSSSISTKSRFLSQFAHRSELQYISCAPQSMADQELFDFQLSHSIASRCIADLHRCPHFCSHITRGSLRIDFDSDIEPLVQFQRVEISVRAHRSVWDHGESRSLRNIADHQWIRARSSLGSGTSFGGSRRRSVQCQCKSSRSASDLILSVHFRIGTISITAVCTACRISTVHRSHWMTSRSIL